MRNDMVRDVRLALYMLLGAVAEATPRARQFFREMLSEGKLSESGLQLRWPRAHSVGSLSRKKVFWRFCRLARRTR